MTEESQNQFQQDPNNVLCRIVDVNRSVQNTFQKFVESEDKSLQVLANLLSEELSKMELFVSQDVQRENQ